MDCVIACSPRHVALYDEDPLIIELQLKRIIFIRSHHCSRHQSTWSGNQLLQKMDSYKILQSEFDVIRRFFFLSISMFHLHFSIALSLSVAMLWVCRPPDSGFWRNIAATALTLENFIHKLFKLTKLSEKLSVIFGGNRSNVCTRLMRLLLC